MNGRKLSLSDHVPEMSRADKVLRTMRKLERVRCAYDSERDEPQKLTDALREVEAALAQQAQPECYCGIQPDGSVKHKAICPHYQAQPLTDGYWVSVSERHKPNRRAEPTCEECGERWPCDVNRLLARDRMPQQAQPDSEAAHLRVLLADPILDDVSDEHLVRVKYGVLRALIRERSEMPTREVSNGTV